MKTTRLAAFLFLITCACASPPRYAVPERVGDWSIRAAAGAAPTTVRTDEAKVFFGQPYVRHEEHEGTTALARLETVTVLEDGWRVGPYLDVGTADFDDVRGTHATLGAAARFYPTAGLFLEGRAGLRGQQLGDELTGLGYDLGAAVGVEYRGFFCTVGYGFGAVELDGGDVQAEFDGLTLMVGGTIRL